MVVKRIQCPFKKTTQLENSSELPRILKPITVHGLTHSNSRPDRAMNNKEIENVNDRKLFSELFDNPINLLLTHIVPPFVDKKDPMFHLQINGEAIWKWREVYGHPSKATRNGFCSVAACDY